MGGVAAALAATSLGNSVILTEEYDWIGGQLTSQMVPPDEHSWIEQFGCTARYRSYREKVRQYYRENLPLNNADRNNEFLNPGSGWVSRLCHEPRIGWQVLCAMVQPAISQGLLQIRQNFIPISCDTVGDKVRSVQIKSLRTEDIEIIHPQFVLDATETGDLLPLSGTEYRVGAESKSQTGEAHALGGEPDPGVVQGFTWCAAMAYDEGSHRVIDKPQNYNKWLNCKPSNWPGKLFDFWVVHPVTGMRKHLPLFPSNPDQWYTLFSYRQIFNPKIYDPVIGHPVTCVNWPQNDYYLGSILDVSEKLRLKHLAESRDLTLCLLYWLQTDAPRHDGRTGYPGLYFQPSFAGTEDGLAQAPYIRESRRIESHFTITEEMVSSEANPGKTRAPKMPKAVGIGAYRMDLHPSTGGIPTLDIGSLPYQIPLGALIPIRMRNLLPACKNLGVTHISNGCYRLHPTEWNIGESAGLLAAFCLTHNCTAVEVLESSEKWSAYSDLLNSQGVETKWPELRPL